MEMTDLEKTIRDYLNAFEARDLSRCLAFFDDDGTVDFQDALYRGRAGVEEWHQDRFDADLRVLEIEEVRCEGEEAVVDLVATSDALKVWDIDKLNGAVRFRFVGEKIKEAKFELRAHNPELWEV